MDEVTDLKTLAAGIGVGKAEAMIAFNLATQLQYIKIMQLRKFIAISNQIFAYLVIGLVPQMSLASPSCLSLFETDKALRPIENQTTISSRSLKIWGELDQEISQVFFKNLQSEKLYDRHLAHVKTLKLKFGLIAGKSHQSQTVEGIIKTYNRYMDAAEARGLRTLRPIFIFDLPNGELIFLRFGEEIPPGAKSHQKELTDEVFEKLILSGFFPVGDSSLTQGSRKPTFEHDLGHLTAFVERPEYMEMLIRHFEDKPNHPDFMAKWGGNAWGRGASGWRTYFYVEAMTVVNPLRKNQMLALLKLSDSMRSRLDEITFEEMETYLRQFSDVDLRNYFTRILRDADLFFTPIGGAARNSGERESTLHNRFVGLLTNALDGKEVDMKLLTAFQLSAIRLRDVTPVDWLAEAYKEAVSSDSKLYPFFNDPELIQYAPSGPFAVVPYVPR